MLVELLGNPVFMTMVASIVVLAGLLAVLKWLNVRQGPCRIVMESLSHANPGFDLDVKSLVERLSRLEEEVKKLQEMSSKVKVTCPVHGEVEPVKLSDGTLLCPHLHILYSPNEGLNNELIKVQAKLDDLDKRLNKLQRLMNKHLMTINTGREG